MEMLDTAVQEIRMEALARNLTRLAEAAEARAVGSGKDAELLGAGGAHDTKSLEEAAGALAAAEKRGQCLWRVACGKERLCREHASRVKNEDIPLCTHGQTA